MLLAVLQQTAEKVAADEGLCPQRLNSLLKNSLQVPLGLKPWSDKKGFIAVLKTLRYPKSEFFTKL